MSQSTLRIMAATRGHHTYALLIVSLFGSAESVVDRASPSKVSVAIPSQHVHGASIPVTFEGQSYHVTVPQGAPATESFEMMVDVSEQRGGQAPSRGRRLDCDWYCSFTVWCCGGCGEYQGGCGSHSHSPVRAASLSLLLALTL